MLPSIAHVVNPDYTITIEDKTKQLIYETLIGIPVSGWNSPHVLFHSALEKSHESGHAIYKKYRDTFKIIKYQYYQKHHLVHFTERLVIYMDKESTKRVYIRVFKKLKLDRKLQREQRRTRRLIRFIQTQKLNEELMAEIDL